VRSKAPVLLDVLLADGKRRTTTVATTSLWVHRLGSRFLGQGNPCRSPRDGRHPIRRTGRWIPHRGSTETKRGT